MFVALENGPRNKHRMIYLAMTTREQPQA